MPADLPAHSLIPRVDSDPPLKAVIFDAGLTLIEAATPVDGVALDVFERLALHVDGERLRREVPRINQHLAERWHLLGVWESEDTVRALFVDAYTNAFAIYPGPNGHHSPAELARRVYDAYQQPHHWRAVPEAKTVLSALKRQQLTVGVLSDWGEGLDTLLAELDLSRYLDFMVVSSRIGVSKPSCRVFDLAVRRAGVEPALALYVGDTYRKDVLGARAAGLPAVLLDRTASVANADCPVVTSLAQVLALVGLA